MKKDEYPKAIADRLGIPVQHGIAGPWMSNQGTVLGDWVRAVSEALDVPYSGKVATMKALVEAVGQSWDDGTMASVKTKSKGGGNISLPAFQALLTGLQAQPAAQQRRQLNGGLVPFEAPQPSTTEDTDVMRAVRVRRGQPRFRADLLLAYEGRCAMSGTDAPATLEAAHIVPYGHGGSYSTSNGLLLRADIHTLFDLLLVSVDVDRGKVIIHPELCGTTYEEELSDALLAPPLQDKDRPDIKSLEAHRQRCGF